MKNKWLTVLLLVSLIKGLVWIFLTPIFQIPDEPSHFSYVQFLSETGRRPLPRREIVSSRELIIVAKAVGFNWKIEHPVWQGYQSNWRDQLQTLDLVSRKNYQQNSYLTTLKRPGLYYSAASLVYKIFYQQPFFWRFFGLRLFSLFMQIIIVWLVYQTAQKLFNKKNLSLAAATAVAFHPGFSFILSGVSYEALGVLVATLFTYLAVAKTKLIWLALTAFLGIFIKPDLIFLVLLLPLVLPKRFRLAAAGTFVLSLLGLILISPLINLAVKGQQPWLDKWLYVLPLKDYNLFLKDFWTALINGRLFSQTAVYLKLFITLHYHQIFAWYWGVFGWLEKTLPPLTYTVLKILSVVSLIGIFKNWRKLWKLLLFVLIQAAVIIANDWLVFITSGQIYGIQGRYFLPAIGAQMILFTYGLSRFISPKILIGLAVLLNLIGLFSLFQYFGNVWF